MLLNHHDIDITYIIMSGSVAEEEYHKCILISLNLLQWGSPKMWFKVENQVIEVETYCLMV